jgi:hypothetical protein
VVIAANAGLQPIFLLVVRRKENMFKAISSRRDVARWGATALTVLLAGAGAAVTGAAPAAAADPFCSFTRTVCLWDQTNYTGTRFTVQAADPAAGACVDLAAHGWGAGRTHSARNTGNQVARLYPTRNCTGSAYQLVPAGTYGSVDFGSNSIYVY